MSSSDQSPATAEDYVKSGQAVSLAQARRLQAVKARDDWWHDNALRCHAGTIYDLLGDRAEGQEAK